MSRTPGQPHKHATSTSNTFFYNNWTPPSIYKTPSNVHSPKCCISEALTLAHCWPGPCSLAQCCHVPTLSSGAPWEEGRDSLGSPQGLSLSLFLSHLPHTTGPPSRGSWPHGPSEFPLLSITSPSSPLPPQAITSGYKSALVAKRPTSLESWTSGAARNLKDQLVQPPTHSLVGENEVQGQELTCLKRHCNMGIMDKLALGA